MSEQEEASGDRKVARTKSSFRSLFKVILEFRGGELTCSELAEPTSQGAVRGAELGDHWDCSILYLGGL